MVAARETDSPAAAWDFLDEEDDRLERIHHLDGVRVMSLALVTVALRRVKATRRALDLARVELEQARERACLARGAFLAALNDAENAAKLYARAQAAREGA